LWLRVRAASRQGVLHLSDVVAFLSFHLIEFLPSQLRPRLMFLMDVDEVLKKQLCLRGDGRLDVLGEQRIVIVVSLRDRILPTTLPVAIGVLSTRVTHLYWVCVSAVACCSITSTRSVASPTALWTRSSAL